MQKCKEYLEKFQALSDATDVKISDKRIKDFHMVFF